MTPHEKFLAFLASAQKFVPDEKREQIVVDAEGMMTDIFVDWQPGRGGITAIRHP